MYGVREDDLPGYAVEEEQYISSGREKHPWTVACELRFIFPVFSGKRKSSGRNSQPHKAPVWRRIVRCGKFLGLAVKTRQWRSVRGLWRNGQKSGPPGHGPGCLQGSKVEGDRVGRRQFG